MKKTCAVLLLLFGFASLSCAAQTALSKYIYDNLWTPITDHNSSIVPGMILEVPLKDGDPQPEPLNADQTALKVESGTAKFDKGEVARGRNVDLGITGLKMLFGDSVAGGFQSAANLSTSGVEMNVYRLTGGEWQKLLQGNGQTQQQLVHDFAPKKAAYFLVVEVASAKHAEVSSSSKFCAYGGIAATTGDCPATTLPPPTSSSTMTPQTSSDLTKAADTAKTATTTSTASASSESAQVRYHQGDSQHVSMDSDAFIPVAMHLELIVNLTNGLDLKPGFTRLRLWNSSQAQRDARNAVNHSY